MSGDTIITVIGNLTADPELRSPSGRTLGNSTSLHRFRCRRRQLHRRLHPADLRPCIR